MPDRKFFFLGYDISLAVQAKRMLLLETHTIEDINQTVWNPTFDHIRNLQNQGATQLLCSSSQPATYQNDKNKLLAFVSLIAPSQKVIYLGTVYNETLAKYRHNKSVSHLANNPEKRRYVIQRGWQGIVRERYGLIIPVKQRKLDQLALTSAVRKFMQTFAPSLLNLPIRWLSSETQIALERATEDAAAQISHPMSQEEINRVFFEDSENFPFNQ